MRAREFDNSKLVVFDIDDTLVNTNTLVNVVRDGEVVKQLNSHDFTHYHLQPGEEFDFGRFRDAREFYTNARPIAPMISRLKQDIATGNKVIMLTARADFNDRDVFLDTFRQYGIDMDRVHVYRAGNLQTRAATEEKKKIILRHLLGQRHYDKVIMYDDAVPNLNAFLSLAQEYPWSRFYAWHVDPQGRATEYHRTGASLGNKLREDAEDLPSVERARAAIPQILARVQRDYDNWDEEDRDTYAGGGICHIIADTMCDVLGDLGIDCTPVSCSFEQHVYIAARFAEGIYTIDIPYHVYETGGGFSWQKIPDVTFSARDVVFYRTSGDPADWQDYIDEAVDTRTMALDFEDQRQDGRWLLQARGNLGRGVNIRVLDTENNNREVAFVDFGLRERWQDGEPYLRAVFVNVETAYRGQGLARRMYQYANDLGNDIMPSDSQTEHGREMWQRLAGRVRQPPAPRPPEPVAAPRSDITKTAAPSWWQRLRGRARAVAEGRISDLDIDLQDQQWEAVVGFVQDGVRRDRDADRMSLDLYRWAGGEQFDVDEELERRGFRNVADLADHIRRHGGRYVAPEFDLSGAASLQDIERLERRRDDDVQENFADGKKPGRKGLSRRVGIPKKATLGQLEKIARSSTGERRRMAQWQLNMRRGQAKKNK